MLAIYIFSVVLALFAVLAAYTDIIDDINHLPQDEWFLIVAVVSVACLAFIFLPVVNTIVAIKFVVDCVRDK